MRGSCSLAWLPFGVPGGALALIGFSGPSRGHARATTSAPAFTPTETIARSFLAEWPGDSRRHPDGVPERQPDHEPAGPPGNRGVVVGARPPATSYPTRTPAREQYEEYPFVLLECRGGPSGTDQVTPETCWTQDGGSRYQERVCRRALPARPVRILAGGGRGRRAVAAASTTQEPYCQRGDGGERDAGQYWVPWVAADGTVYDGGAAGSCGEPPEATDGRQRPSRARDLRRHRPRRFGERRVRRVQLAQNATLGCSASVTCSLVAVPIMGVSCDADLSPAPTQLIWPSARRRGSPPGTAADGSPPNFPYDLTVSGSLWWSPSNWRNRITVPLTFAPPPTSSAPS